MMAIGNISSPEDHVSGQAARKHDAMAVLEAHPFQAPSWLKNGHAQTIWAPVMRRISSLPRRKERVETPDGDFVDLFWVDGNAGKPVVLMLHGLEGSADSKYILGMNRKLADLGWTSVTMQFRGCGSEMNRAPRMYHSGETTDLAFVAGRLSATYARIYIAGFSLGGNVTVKWLGEWANVVPANVVAAAAVSVPYDLVVSGPHIDKVLGGFYAKHFLRTLVRKAIQKERQFPGCVDIARVRAARTLYDFDHHATAQFHGFQGATHYYETQRSGPYLGGVRVPTLLLSSADDPFNPGSTLPRAAADASDYLHPMFTERGGHVGFVYGSPRAPRYWAEEQIVRFFAHYEAISDRNART